MEVLKKKIKKKALKKTLQKKIKKKALKKTLQKKIKKKALKKKLKKLNKALNNRLKKTKETFKIRLIKSLSKAMIILIIISILKVKKHNFLLKIRPELSGYYLDKNGCLNK
jgi:predicted flavoprotein YhiN